MMKRSRRTSSQFSFIVPLALIIHRQLFQIIKYRSHEPHIHVRDMFRNKRAKKPCDKINKKEYTRRERETEEHDEQRKNDRQKASRPRCFAAMFRRIYDPSHHRMLEALARSFVSTFAGRTSERAPTVYYRRSSTSLGRWIVNSFLERHYRFIVASVMRPLCSPRPRPRGLIFAGRRTSIILPCRPHPRPRKEARWSTSSWVSAVVSVALSY